jgi:hypothetical protein
MKLEKVKGMLQLLKGIGLIATILEFFYGKKLKEEENENAVYGVLKKHPELLEKAASQNNEEEG